MGPHPGLWGHTLDYGRPNPDYGVTPWIMDTPTQIMGISTRIMRILLDYPSIFSIKGIPPPPDYGYLHPDYGQPKPRL